MKGLFGVLFTTVSTALETLYESAIALPYQSVKHHLKEMYFTLNFSIYKVALIYNVGIACTQPAAWSACSCSCVEIKTAYWPLTQVVRKEIRGNNLSVYTELFIVFSICELQFGSDIQRLIIKALSINNLSTPGPHLHKYNTGGGHVHRNGV